MLSGCFEYGSQPTDFWTSDLLLKDCLSSNIESFLSIRFLWSDLTALTVDFSSCLAEGRGGK
jgi:hypothetical protein